MDEAFALLASEDNAVPLAGGQSLLPMMALREARPGCLVDLSKLGALRGIAIEGNAVQIGSMVTHAENARAKEHELHLPLLREAVRHVAHEAVRQRGTIGGSLAHGDPSAEMPLVAVALDARVVVAGTKGEREVRAAEFFRGAFTTALQPGELVVRVDLPITDHVWAFEEFTRRSNGTALASAAVGLRMRDGRCESARVAIGGVADRPLRATQAEEGLAGRAVDDVAQREAARCAAADLDPPTDVHASTAYRRHLAETLVRRALSRCLEDPAA